MKSRGLLVGGATTVAPYAVLVVAGLGVALFVLVRGAAADVATASTSREVAAVSSEAIAVLSTEYAESGLAVTYLTTGEASRLEAFHEAAVATDAAVDRFSERRRSAPESVRELFAESAAALTALPQIRDSVVAREADPEADSYGEVIAPMRDALAEAAIFTQSPPEIQARRAIVRLVGVADALAARRDLIWRILQRRQPPTSDEEAQLTLFDRDRDINVNESFRLLEGDEQQAIADLEARPTTAEAENLRDTIVLQARASEFSVEPAAWYATASTEIEDVVSIAAMLGDQVERLSGTAEIGSKRSVALTSLLVGGLLALSVVAASRAISASRGRIVALREHNELVAGLLRWFASESRPDIPEIDAEVRYVPSASYAGAGGDWYDLFKVDGGRLALVVGDVSGHGSRAVAHMAEVRNVLRGLAAGVAGGPAKQLELVDRTIELAEMTTTFYAVLDPETGAMVYSRAGHLPAIVRRARGAVELLDGGTDPPIGIGSDAARVETSVSLDPGDLIVLFTDGLIERPGRDLMESVGDLADFVAGADGDDLRVLADQLVARRPHRVDDDDLSLLIVRLTGWSRLTPGSLDVESVEKTGDLEQARDG